MFLCLHGLANHSRDGLHSLYDLLSLNRNYLVCNSGIIEVFTFPRRSSIKEFPGHSFEGIEHGVLCSCSIG
jgi:hypothetical protein